VLGVEILSLSHVAGERHELDAIGERHELDSMDRARLEM
jgi:hypothetical protein